MIVCQLSHGLHDIKHQSPENSQELRNQAEPLKNVKAWQEVSEVSAWWLYRRHMLGHQLLKICLGQCMAL